MKLKNKITSYFGNTSGNMAIAAAVMTPVLLAVLGASISIAEVSSKRSKLQSHADILSLEMAKQKLLFTDKEARAYYHAYISVEMNPSEDCSFDFIKRPRDGLAEATVKCGGEVKSFLASFLDKKSLPYSVTSTATLSATKTFEVAFVFDISDSMIGQEIEDLKEGLETISESPLFADEDSRLSLIPFANTVRLGPEFENFVTPGTGYDAAGGEYNGCFNRDATDPEVDLNSNPTFPLVKNTLNSGKVVCQNENMTAVFHEKATEWDIKDMASNIETAFGTGMSDALVWGFRSVDPSLRGVMSPASNYPLGAGQSSKHIIMMTDGRPYDRPWSGPGGGEVTRQLSLDRFKDVCEKLPLEANGINFHLINYNNNALSDEHLEVFKGCVSGEGKFHDVARGNLTSVLGELTNEISTLRLSH